MKKTPDEIKKGLEDGVPYHVHKGEACLGYTALAETLHKMSDALAYIQQLETDNAELLTKNQQLETKCYQLERERYVAVLGLRGNCAYCKHNHYDSEECRDCDVYANNWEWRGVKED